MTTPTETILQPEMTRRRMLMRLGLAATAIYAAPTILQLSEAKASGSFSGGGGASFSRNSFSGGGGGSSSTHSSGQMMHPLPRRRRRRRWWFFRSFSR